MISISTQIENYIRNLNTCTITPYGLDYVGSRGNIVGPHIVRMKIILKTLFRLIAYET
ncbi:MAG: hypothetical protein V1838_03365 [Patescibacteria group bacterium]